MRLIFLFFFISFALIFNASASDNKIFEFNFLSDVQEWEGDFCDYPFNEEKFYELAWGWEDLPFEINQEGKIYKKGIFLSGNNHSDDLFMFIRRKISDLKPNKEYALQVFMLLETNVAAGAIGIGGSPGESVYVKVGASGRKPEKILINDFYYLNVDKGNQSQSGMEAIVIGNLANDLVDSNKHNYMPKMLIQKEPLIVKTNSNGELWAFIGTDSGFEGKTKFYIASIKLELVLVDLL